MRPIKSLIDKNSESYRANHAANLAAVERLKGEFKKSTLGGGEQYVKRHLARGKLPPRERVEMLLDEGSYFLKSRRLPGMAWRTSSSAWAWSEASGLSRAANV